MSSNSNLTPQLGDQNKRILIACLALVTLMLGMAYAAVPLYDMFCRVTGYGGTTQRVEAVDVPVMSGRTMNIRFDANTTQGLPWRFVPTQRSLNVNVGEQMLAFYEAKNYSGKAVTGTATFNVTPMKAGIYFNKIDCFCFTEQTLPAGKSVKMPVSFFVDPAIEEDPRLDDVKTITLSYTFFPSEPAQPAM